MQVESYGGGSGDARPCESDGQNTTAGDAPADPLTRAVEKRARRAAQRLGVVRAEVARTFSRVAEKTPKPVQHVAPVARPLKRSASRLNSSTARGGECVFALVALEGGYIGSLAEGCGRPRCPVCVVERRRTARVVSDIKRTPGAVSPALPPNSGSGDDAPESSGKAPNGAPDGADGTQPNPASASPPMGVRGRAGRGSGARSEGVQGGNPPASLDTPSKQRRKRGNNGSSGAVVSSAGGSGGASEGASEPEQRPTEGSAKPPLRRGRGRRGWYALRPRHWKFRAWRRAIASRLEELVKDLPEVSRVRKSMERRAKAMRVCGARVLVRECSGCNVGRLGSGIPDDGSGRAVDEMGAPLRGPRPCGARSCSFCERRAAAKRASALMAAMHQVPQLAGHAWRFVTISIPYDTLDPEAVTVEALAKRRELAFAILAEAWTHGQAMHKERWQGLTYEEKFAWLVEESSDRNHRAWWRSQSPEAQASWLKAWGLDVLTWERFTRKERVKILQHERNSGILRAAIDGRWSMARRWMRPQFKVGTKGAAMFARCELGGRGGGHVHAHALIYSPWVNVDWLRAISERMGGGFVWVTAANVATAREVAKYTVKSCSPLDEGWLAGEQRLCLNPTLVARWELATFGVRMSRVRGALVGLMDTEEPDPDDDQGDEDVTLHGAERDADVACTFCGKRGGWRWAVKNMGEWVSEAHERGGAALWGSRWGVERDDDDDEARHKSELAREGPSYAPEP